ncbi:CRPV-186 [Crowpox virus]|nr:CRPV-186 [Crowpox virus]
MCNGVLFYLNYLPCLYQNLYLLEIITYLQYSYMPILSSY